MSEIQEPERPDDSTYALDPEPGELGEDLEQEAEQPSKSVRAVVQPLPRLWKGEPDPSEEPEGTRSDRSTRKNARDVTEGKPTEKKASKPKPKANPPKEKPKKRPTDGGDENEKKVLIEETPTFDTYEARQRARLIVGGLSVFCVMLGCYISYHVLFGGSPEVDLSAEAPPMVQAAPTGPDALEREARYMLGRAQEFAKAGRIDQAVEMLKRVVTSYKGTESAAQANAALQRPMQNLPLFLDGPALLAERKRLEPPPSPSTGSGMRPAPPPSQPGPVAMGPPPGAIGPAAQQPPPVPNQPAQQPPPVPNQPQTTDQRQPDQAMPPTGPGQVAIIVPVAPGGPPEVPKNNERPDVARPAVAPQALPQRVLPPGFKAKIEAGFHESGWPLVIVGERDDAPMVLVPGGTFTMGNDHGESVEAPAHTVRLSTFYIDKHEVTNRQFRTFLGDKYRGRPPGNSLSDDKIREQSADAPAVLVTYRDAETFVLWAGKRLPTEAQWEMAARSADGRRFPWGDQPANWSRPREYRQVDPVMSFPEDCSVYGVYDMAGNVMEWTRDFYDPKYFQRIGDKIAENPTGPEHRLRNSIQYVVKGGSKNWVVSARQGVDSDKRLTYLGFRGSMAVEGPEAAAGIAPHPAKPAAQPGAPPPGTGPAGGDVPF
jgi:formylglycine-generating enzyme